MWINYNCAEKMSEIKITNYLFFCAEKNLNCYNSFLYIIIIIIINTFVCIILVETNGVAICNLVIVKKNCSGFWICFFQFCYFFRELLEKMTELWNKCCNYLFYFFTFCGEFKADFTSCKLGIVRKSQNSTFNTSQNY